MSAPVGIFLRCLPAALAEHASIFALLSLADTGKIRQPQARAYCDVPCASVAAHPMCVDLHFSAMFLSSLLQASQQHAASATLSDHAQGMHDTS